MVRHNMLNVILKFFGSDILAKSITVLSLPFFALLMGPNELGKFSEWFSIYNILVAIVSIGIPSYFLVLIHSSQYSDESALTSQLLSFFLEWLLWIIPASLLFFFLFYDLFYGCLTLCAAILFSIINYNESILRFNKNAKSYLWLQLSFAISTSLIPLGFVLINPVWSYRCWGYVLGLALVIMVVRIICPYKLRVGHINTIFKIGLLQFGAPIVLITGINWLKLGIDLQLLKNIESYSSSGILFFCFQIISIINIIAASLNRSSTVLFYELLAQRSFRQFYFFIGKISLILIFVSVCVVVISDFIVRLYMPDYKMAIPILYPMALGIIFYGVGQFISAFFMFYQQSYFVSMAVFISSLSHPFISYWLINHFGWGTIGYSYLFSNCIFFCVVLLLNLFCNRAYSVQKMTAISIKNYK